MFTLNQLAKSLAKGRKALDDVREGIDNAGAVLRSGAELCQSASAQVDGAVRLGEKVGTDFAEGIRKLTAPAPQKVDVKVVQVKANGTKR